MREPKMEVEELTKRVEGLKKKQGSRTRYGKG